jgi:hypothetical protein
MFKLIKILNSGVNVPEPVQLKKDKDMVFDPGVALKFSGGILTMCSTTERPTHISHGYGKAGSDHAVCYEIFDNMLFEAEIADDPYELKVGDKIDLDTDNKGYTSLVSTVNTEEVATVIDLCGAKELGDKIVIKFN